jgi:predicted ATPase
MLKSVDLSFTETGALRLPLHGITIFVGPNNSGKSLVLREIEQLFRVQPMPGNLKIVTDYEVKWPALESVKAKIEKAKIAHPEYAHRGGVIIGMVRPGEGRVEQHLDENDLLDAVRNRNEKHWIATQYLSLGVLRLDGRSRFNLTNDTEGQDLTNAPNNILAYLFQEDEPRNKVRRLIHDAFGLYFVVDPTKLGYFRIRLSNETPNEDEQSLNSNARAYHNRAIHIKNASDGVQAFTGIVTAVLSGEYHTILIDEPEAFLHPPLARKLGKNLAALAAEEDASLVAATHSADFLMGCVEASNSVRVVRLEYSESKSRAKNIDPEELRSLLQRPLMRSANVISGLFHDGVIVCESDNDRAFYSEIYNRIARINQDYPAIHFVNAQNKQTIFDIIGPLRRFGVPAAAIPDVDLVKDGGKTWTNWMKAAQVPGALHLGLGQQRSSIYEALKRSGKDMKTDGGIQLLSADDRLAAEDLFETLEQYGLFPVRNGELETWLPALRIPGKKTDWAVAMLERLGGDPNDVNYVGPEAGDVWDFLRKIVAWVRDPGRKGTR